MDAGTVLGGVSLAIQVLNECMKGYSVIENALNMSDDFRSVSLQFQIEHSRLQNFSMAAGLSGIVDENALGRGIQANKTLLLHILTEIKSALNKFAKEDERQETAYSSNSNFLNQSHLHRNLGEVYNSLATKMAVIPGQENKPSGVFQSFTWSLFHKNEFVKLLRKLRHSNNHLHELLDEHQSQILQDTQQETHMTLVQVRNSVDDLKTLVEAAQSLPRFPNESLGWQQKVDIELENLATFKAFYASLLGRKTYDTRNLKIPASEIQFEFAVALREQHPQALLVPDDARQKRVWINWQNKQPPDNNTEETSLSPIEELTALLMAPKPDEFCVPPCLGYCNLGAGEETQNLGLVFENPPDINPQLRPISLLQAIKQLPKPSLTQRVALAHKIAQCLLYLHSVNWLHKGLRSENILLFPRSDGEYEIISPYLTGFDYSRRARFNEATGDVPRVGSMEVYRHPDIQMNGPNLYYRKTFDIYSLGIVLIEIAHWRPIATVMGIEDTINISPKATSDVQQRLLSSEPTLLRTLQSENGDKYFSAVKNCIAARDSFGVSRADLETSASTSIAIQQGFNAQVVRVLREIII